MRRKAFPKALRLSPARAGSGGFLVRAYGYPADFRISLCGTRSGFLVRAYGHTAPFSPVRLALSGVPRGPGGPWPRDRAFFPLPSKNAPRGSFPRSAVFVFLFQIERGHPAGSRRGRRSSRMTRLSFAAATPGSPASGIPRRRGPAPADRADRGPPPGSRAARSAPPRARSSRDPRASTRSAHPWGAWPPL